jgi:protein-ribulosamine 3-kinase
MAPRSEAALAAVQEALAGALGQADVVVASTHAVGGGCIHHALRLETSAGRFFAKWSADAPPDIFLREADGLRALADAGSSIVIPRVLAATEVSPAKPGVILMEYLETRRAEAGDDAALGRGLAAIHRRRADAFGFPVPTYCGTTRQDNAWSASWAGFYAERRLRPLLDAIDAERGWPAGGRGVFDRLLERLPQLVPDASPPALVHGDLWSGNVAASVGGPALFDPASAYADREMEFGITTLFGGFGARFWAAYEEAWPLEPGWRERNALYQCYHLLNHHLLFGGHYGGQAAAAARKYL